MVKKPSGASKLRQKAERRCKEAGHAADPPRGPAVPQKLQHKISKRVRFLERVAGSGRLVVKGGTAKRRAKAGISERLTNYSSLAASLAEAAEQDEKSAAAKSPARKGLGAGGAKKRMRILQQETARLQQVLGHAQYRADPIAAVTSHLSSTLPAAPEPPKPMPQDRKQQKARRKWEQKLKQRDAPAMNDDKSMPDFGRRGVQ